MAQAHSVMQEGRDGYGDQIVTCDVGVSLHSKTHPLFMKYINGTSTQCYAYQYPSLFSALFYNPYMSLFSFSLMKGEGRDGHRDQLLPVI